MSSITKRNNPNRPWSVRYRADGKQCERSFRTRAQAQKFQTETDDALLSSKYIDPAFGNVPFSEWAEEWISTLAKASTRSAYRSALVSRIAPAFAGKTLAQVAKGDAEVRRFLTRLADDDLSESLAARCLSVITGAIRHGVRDRRLPAGRYLDGIKVVRPVQHRAEVPDVSFGQLCQMADSMGPTGLAVLIMRGCGLRVGEALAVRAEDFKEGWLTVSEQVSRDGSLVPCKDRRKGESRRTPVPAWLAARVASHPVKSGRLFPGMTYSKFRPRFARAAKVADCPGLHVHGLRHMFAATLLGLPYAVPITDVAEWLGHRDIRITYAVYSFLVPESEKSARAALDAIAL